MSDDKRLHQLVKLGVAKHVDEFSKVAGDIIRGLSDAEFEFLLSIRKRVYEKGGDEAGKEYDHGTCLIF